MSESHHTKEQVQLAFQNAPQLLEEVQRLGFRTPSLTLYSDASGSLNLGRRSDVEGLSSATIAAAQALVKSTRWAHCWVCFPFLVKGQEAPEHDCDVSIQFCCGLVDHTT